jgi:hypothetical protein
MEELDFKIPAKYVVIAAVLLRMKSDHIEYLKALTQRADEDMGIIEEVPAEENSTGVNGEINLELAELKKLEDDKAKSDLVDKIDEKSKKIDNLLVSVGFDPQGHQHGASLGSHACLTLHDDTIENENLILVRQSPLMIGLDRLIQLLGNLTDGGGTDRFAQDRQQGRSDFACG